MNHEGSATLRILNVLMNADDYLTTKQIIERAECERKTIYNVVASLECHGFGIDVKKVYMGNTKHTCNAYKYIGLFGTGA